jgi:hypothetical protein
VGPAASTPATPSATIEPDAGHPRAARRTQPAAIDVERHARNAAPPRTEALDGIQHAMQIEAIAGRWIHHDDAIHAMRIEHVREVGRVAAFVRPGWRVGRIEGKRAASKRARACRRRPRGSGNSVMHASIDEVEGRSGGRGRFIK